MSSRKRGYAEISADDEQDEYQQLSQSVRSQAEEKSEIDRYLEGPLSMSETLLDWWKANQAVYPRLARMARYTFAVPATHWR